MSRRIANISKSQLLRSGIRTLDLKPVENQRRENFGRYLVLSSLNAFRELSSPQHKVVNRPGTFDLSKIQDLDSSEAFKALKQPTFKSAPSPLIADIINSWAEFISSHWLKEQHWL